MMAGNVYTVSQVNSYIASILSESDVLSDICLRGEISNCKYHPSGHIYFTLKDSGSQINCVMWATYVRGLNFRLENGLQVLAYGQIKAYEKGGLYQLYADTIKPDGVGALYELYERLKRKLAAEGLFDPMHKKPVPVYCKTVGIVTASTGAAIRDIVSISKRRNPYVRLILYPAIVQGTGTAESVINGIKTLEKMKPDVIIIGRGGGSIEDLWGFNDEALARVVYDCEIPVISAVGHETDITITDYVADLRAATPSEAAEKAVCEIDGILGMLVDLHSDLNSAVLSAIDNYRQSVERLSLSLKLYSPQGRLESNKKDISSYADKLERLIRERINREKQSLALNAKALDGLSPLKRLEAGYAYVTGKDGHNVKSTADVKPGDEIKITVSDGVIGAKVTGTD